MARGKIKRYRDADLVEMIACGQFTHAQVGRALGLSRAHVAKIARGSRRNDLQKRIREARQAKIDHTYPIAAKWLELLVKQHVDIGLSGPEEPARKCREAVMELVGLRRK